MKRVLIAGLLLMALFAAGLHWRIHNPVDRVTGRIRAPFLVANAVQWIDVVVVTILFLRRRTAPLAFLLNGIIAIYGSVMMFHYTAIMMHPAGLKNWLINSLVPDIAALWADFMLGAALWLVYVREGQALAARGVSRRTLPRIRGEHLVVVGGGVAGVTAAEAARRTHPTLAITLVGEEPELPYRRLRLTPYMAGQESRESLLLRPRQWYRDNRINLVTGTRVVGVAPDRHEVTVRGPGGSMRYDRLILATGATPRRLPLEGVGRRNVSAVRRLADADALKAAVQEGDACVVIGGGLLGLETAKALALAGGRVQVVERAPYLLSRQLDARGAERLGHALQREGLSLHLGATIEALEGGEMATSLRLGSGVELFADLVVVAVGVQPDTLLAGLAGCQVERAVVVDDHMATTVEDIYAAGDATQHKGIAYGIWPAALEQGRVAGINAAGGGESYAGTVPFNPLKVVDIRVYSVGVISAETSADREVVLETEGFYKKLVVRDGVLVGAVLVGDDRDSEALAAAIVERLDVAREAATGAAAILEAAALRAAPVSGR
jgi:nitrite reductase (NADH) large subunit